MRLSTRRRLVGCLAFVLPLVVWTVASTAQDARERTLFVSAVGADGRPLDNLTPADFIVQEDGVRREVLRLSRAIEPIDIALLVDNSAMAEPAILHMREGLRRFVAKMAGPHQIALVALAARPTILVDYTTDRARLEDGIGRVFAMQQSGATMLDAIVEVTRGMRRREASRAVVVPIVTDGVEYTNRYARDITEALSAAQAALHALAIGTFYVTPSDTVERERALVLDMSTRDSGGQRITLLIPSAVVDALDRLAAELSSQYKLVYARPQSLIPPEKTTVTSARAGVTMRAAPLRGEPGA
jgi:VWFA-related protein